MLTTKNESCGFYGKMGEWGKDAEAAWATAMAVIGKILPQVDEEAIQAFLDSSRGEHFAGGVLRRSRWMKSLRNAIKITAKLWQKWKTQKHDEVMYDIPCGTPCLEGLLIAAEICASLGYPFEPEAEEER
jgi:hypothetical protein